MRPIKFRAWDVKWKKYRLNPLIDENSFVNDTFKNDDYVFEQFTGLIDKNGIEIYYNDVLEDTEGNKYHVTEHRLAPTFIFKGIGCETHYQTPYCTQKDYVIIGNIYENPELLNQQQNTASSH